jgi:muramoyltetrapeptide carboxypeptidase
VEFPQALRPGDRVAVVAPSSPFSRELFLAGLAWVAQRYSIAVQEDVFSREGFLAGDDGRRAKELARAMRDPDVRAILVARGGYGATRIVTRLPWADMTPKWIVGFSDTTALHVQALGRSMACVHGPHVTGLGASSQPRLVQNRAAWLAALEHDGPRSWRGLRVLHTGRASGPLYGGNLTLLCAAAASNALVIPPGAIVLLEDVTERPYRVDRLLTSLIEGGHLSRASAVVFGSFDQCEPGKDGVTVDQVLAERSRVLGIPLVAGAPFGHGAHNEAFTLGAAGELDGGTLTWSARR